MARQLRRHGMGWLPDYPDIRDYTARHAKIAPLLERTRGALPAAERALPSAVDLREWCSPIEDQGALGSCTAQAGAGLVEYFEKRAFGKYIDASRLFLYKVTRNLLHWTGDRGAFIRTTMGAIVLFGLPPEEYWPYVAEVYDNEPPAFCYAFAHNYQGISYFRLDPPGTSADTLLEEVKSNLAAGVPAMFGFTVYSSIAQAETTGRIPYPAPGEGVVGGHAVVAVGYDDGMRIKNADPNGGKTVGALSIRNSWGAGWGTKGYGWLPYDYLLDGLANDWWTLLKSEWIDTGQFQ